MSRFHLSVALLVLLFTFFGMSVVATVPLLPARVATHFDAAGEPNGWMTRDDHLGFMCGFGLAFPLGIIGICWSVRFLPVGCLNIPHKEYWLAKEHRAETDDYLFRHSIWLGCLGVGFVTGLHWVTVLSNLCQPVQLPVVWVVGVAGSFLTGTALWVICLFRRFRIPVGAREASVTSVENR